MAQSFATKAKKSATWNDANAAAKSAGFKGSKAYLLVLARPSKRQGNKIAEIKSKVTHNGAGLDQRECIVAAEVSKRSALARTAAVAVLQAMRQ